MRGVACSSNVGFLRPAFEVFLNNLERFGQAMGWSDLAHFYNERATLSLFAAACWQSGLIALEEFISPKGDRIDWYNGRADMWAYCPIADQHIAIEAKQGWPKLNTRPQTITNLVKNADEAAAQNQGADMLASLTFLVPTLDPSVDREDVIGLFRGLHDNLLESGIDALAWWFPEAASENPGKSRKTGEEMIWPGVLAVMRVVKIRGRSRPIAKRSRLKETPWSQVPRPDAS